MAPKATWRAAIAAVSMGMVTGLAACAPLPPASSSPAKNAPVSTPVTSVVPFGPDLPSVPPSSTDSSRVAPLSITGDFCADLKSLNEAPTSQSNDAAAAFRLLDELKNEAPAELQDVFDLITTAIAQLGTTDASDDAAVQRAYAAITDPNFQSGMQRLGSYTKDTCGFTLEGVDDSSAATVTVTEPPPAG
jgi:hypothetical protein